MIKENIKALAKKYGITLIYIFGSQSDKGRRYLEGEDVSQDALSDLDIAVAFENPPAEAVGVYGDIYKEFSKIFEPFRIDLVFMHEVDTLFRYEIIKGVRIYEADSSLADAFEEDIMKRAEDLLFKKKYFDNDVMEAIENGYIEFEYSPGP